MRKLPKVCEHGAEVASCGFYSLDDQGFQVKNGRSAEESIVWDQDSPDYNAPMIFYIPTHTVRNKVGTAVKHYDGCLDSKGAMRPHIVLPSWEEDVSLWSELEVSRGAGRRRKVK